MTSNRTPAPTSRLREFLLGLREPFRAVRFLAGRPSLWPAAALPFFLCLALYIGAMAAGWHYLDAWLTETFAPRAGAWRALEWIIKLLYWVASLFLSAVAFVPVASLIANPFNDWLSERTERIYLDLKDDTPFSFAHFIRCLRTGLAGEIMRAATVAVLLIAAFTLNIIPGVGQLLASAASAFITIRYVSIEYTSFSMDRRAWTWSRKREFMRRNRARTMGFGSVAFLILMTPLLNAAFIPVSAVAGTLLFCDAERDSL